jgi:DNA-binding GntR family transcriptional regulator
MAKHDTEASNLSLGESVYRAILDAMRTRKLKPGDRLREEEVARSLGVSRTPVREALGRLQARGLVGASGGRGLVVRSLSAAEVVELYAMREIIEGAAARLAAQHASQPELDALADFIAGFEANLDAPDKLAQINRQLHEAIHRGARNRYLDAASRELQDAISVLGITTFSVNGRPSQALTEHREMVEAIAARNADKAEQLARSHIREALRTRLRILGES